METGDPLVSASWLKEHISAPDIRIVDATWFAPFTNPAKTGHQAYMEGHIPGAHFFDIEAIAQQDTDLPHMLPDPVMFSSRVRKLGIGDGNRIIVYDQNGFIASARVWWMLRVMGHEDVKVLDGGYAAWLAAGGDVEDLPPVAVERHFTARVRADLIKDAAQVHAISESGSHKLIDSRAAGRFTGEAPEPREGLSSGHIPGSVCVPSSDLLNADGTMKSAEDLKALFDSPMKATVVTCGSGVSAAVAALALARLGNWDVALYDGSWTEWASDPERPIAKGAA